MGLDAAGSSLFVGRADEADRLVALTGVGGAGADHGSVVLSGDAGIGKTRLLAEVAGTARDHGWTVLVGHCLSEAGQSLPYLPFLEVLGRLEAEAPEAVERAVRAHPALARLLPGHRAGVPDAATADRADVESGDRGDLVAGVHAALEEVGATTPLLLVVEDVHWADQSSRDLLTLLFTRGFSSVVSVVASYRSDDLHRRHPLRATLAHWSRLAQVARLDLPPLPDAAVRELVHGLQAQSRNRPLADSDVRAVVERAEGNAFFAEELVAASTMGHTGLAEDLSRLLLVRFDQLGAPGQHVVRVASAAGRHVSHQLLATVAGLPEPELDAGLRDAVEHHVLVPLDSGGGYAFRHALLGETVYDDLLPGERVRAHERYAAALTADHALGSWAELARHASAAGQRDVAREASVRAGDSALRMAGPEEAWRHFSLALSLMPETADDDEVDGVTLRAAAAATAVGRLYKALDLLQDRLERRPSTAPPAGRAELLAALATAARVTESTLDTLAAAKEGLALLDPVAEAHPRVRAQLLAARVQALADRGRDEEALVGVEEAVAAARSAGMGELADEMRVVEARITERAGDPEKSRRALEALIESSRSPGDPAQARAFHHLGWLHHRAGRLDEAVDVYRRGVERARAVGRPWAPYAFDGRLLAGIAAYERGRWDESLAILAADGEAPPEPAGSSLRAARMYVAAGRGEVAALTELEATRPWWEREGLVALLAGTAAVDLHADAGDLDRATAVHDEVVDVLSRVWDPLFQGQLRLGTLLLGQLASHVQRVPTSARAAVLARGAALAETSQLVWDQALTRPGNDGPESTAWLARSRAEALRLRWLGGEDVDPAELVESWRSAVAAFEAYGHVFEAARSRARLGVALRSSGHADGSAELAAALDVAVRLGAQPLRAEIRATGAARPPGRPTSRHGEALTAREREILALVALGRSNKQIGTQLFISGKTASVHVSNILAKLGVAGRGEAVAVARERGLID
ncbi:AAA family ATPase [Pedococcus sp. KACC 23699]|uniref:AAA family ATPase n=1 Tax=Pedococcus sp. KACC 23699 TaxID=3149228 RepID=A0AAU7JT11_9MICO